MDLFFLQLARSIVCILLSSLILLTQTAACSAVQESKSAANDKPNNATSSWRSASAIAVDTERQRFANEMKQLAAKARELNMPEAAKVAESQIIRFAPDRQYIFIPIGTITPSKLANEASADSTNPTDAEKSFQKRLQKSKQKFAANLFELVPKRVMAEEAAAAYQLLHEVLVYDPEHAEARRILGFRNDEKLGWIRSAKATRTAKGTTARRMVGWRKGTYTTVYSPHFTIYSAAGEKAGLKLANELERTYWVWRQVFFEFQSGTRQVSEWLNTKRSDRFSSKKYEVYLFRNRAQYLSDLAAVPNVQISTGYYDDQAEASFFYPDEDGDVSTWRHETVHQLLQENAKSKVNIKERGQAWLVEGIAMYFETMKVHEGYVTLGGFDAFRLQYARLRCKRENFFIPMPMLDAMTTPQLQASGDAGRIYSQSAGVAQFLMVGQQGNYRDKFIQYVRHFYREKRLKQTLAEQTMPLDQLDRAYKQFLEVSAEQVRQYFNDPSTDPALIKALALGQSGIGDKEVEMLADCTNLEWLQLSENRGVTDQAVASLVGLGELNQLFLDVTAITDEAGPHLAKLTALVELDLASTRITDATVNHLVGLQQLDFLMLANTGVTDSCIDSLKKLPELKVVDLRQTKVTDAAIAELKQARPDLEVMK